MASQRSGWEDFKRLGQMISDKVRSHPIGQIEETLRTHKPPKKRMKSTPPSNPQRAKRVKSPTKGRR